MGHAHAIDLVQNVVGQILPAVERHVAVERSTLRKMTKQVIQAPARLSRQECLLLPPGEQSIPEKMRFIGRQQRTFKQPFEFVVEPDLGIGGGPIAVHCREQKAAPGPRDGAQRPCKTVGLISQISAEEFVSAITGQCDFYRAGRHFG